MKPNEINILKIMIKVATFTVSIPEDLKKKMDEHPEINWPEYLKKRFERGLLKIKILLIQAK